MMEKKNSRTSITSQHSNNVSLYVPPQMNQRLSYQDTFKRIEGEELGDKTGQGENKKERQEGNGERIGNRGEKKGWGWMIVGCLVGIGIAVGVGVLVLGRNRKEKEMTVGGKREIGKGVRTDVVGAKCQKG